MAKERFYGVGEPLIQRERDQGIRAERCLELVKGLGCNACRSWMHLTEILDICPLFQASSPPFRKCRPCSF